jgi:exosortase family protein XrtM
LRLPLFIRFLFKSNSREITFIGKFILFYLIGLTGYLLLRPMISAFVTEKLTAGASAPLINLVMPGEHASVHGATISGSVSLTIAVGCDGIEGLILIVASICAFPMSHSRKWAGIGIGAGVIYISNLLRVVALYYIFKRYPVAFSFVHIYAGQVFTIMVGFLFFLTWVGRFAIRNEAAH